MPADPQTTRRERLLATAAKLFARWGFDKTPVTEVAREAGVSKGAVYLEFPSKDALFKGALYRALTIYTENWLRRFEADPDASGFASMFRHSLAAIDADPLMKALMTRDQRVFGSFLRREKDLMGLAVPMREALFLQMQEAGIMRDDIPAPVIANLVSSFGYGMITSEDVIPESHRLPFEDALHGLGSILDRGLAPDPPGDPEVARSLILSFTEQMRAALERGFVGQAPNATDETDAASTPSSP